MGKRKDMIHPRFLAGNVDDYINKKKHKKHKKHKKKHHRDDGQSFSSEALESDSGMVLKPPQLKLKIKLGGQTLGTKSVPTFTVIPDSLRVVSPLNVDSDDGEDDEDSDDDVPSEGVPIEQYRAWLDEDSNLDPSPMPHMDTYSLLEVPMDEEERWLDALEKGELDDNGELKRDIDESLLTARQKALLHKQQSQPLLELPMGYKEKELTAEMMQKREERARKRRLQAAKKAEESKNQTIERLTKTSKAKIKSMKERKSKQGQLPMVRYSSSAQGASVSYPAGIPHLTPASPQAPPPTPVNCGVSGCANLKKYSCSKTGTPLCSMECYKKNLTLVEGVA
ncbi:INO80 complex subunit B isoform X1 [Triplophysa dalaica]|uniref:INO80 complex subunit B isoform X1 n=2 Tax=Triplophysa dalaica TaxID=1582913 RepID=UPI0024DFB9C7|nr:INO80 complex subunit B isoform X1 [Triplophysa dalaica]XP_056614197.1 INO80 complex subunit B isoform X1 [Triplophysa dalaica]